MADRILLALIAAGLWANVLISALKPAPDADLADQMATMHKDLHEIAGNLSNIEDRMPR